MRAGRLLSLYAVHTAIISGAIAIALSLQPKVALAADAASPTFDIVEFNVTGNTLLAPDEVSRIVAPYQGKSRGFDNVQAALAALQAAYRKRGYSAVQALLPEQELKEGVVAIQVIERKIGNFVTVAGNQFYSSENVLHSVPSLREGTVPNTQVIARSLKVANENPTKQTAVLFKNRESDPSLVDATLKVIDEKPWKAFITLDNTGSEETGHSRVGFGFQHFNLWNRDHRLTAQFITTSGDLVPGEMFNDVKIFGMAYTIPLYELGDSVDFIAAYSNVDAAVSLLPSGLSSAGHVYGAHYNHNFDKAGNYQHKLTAALDYRASRIDEFPDLNVTSSPFSLTYGGIWQGQAQQLSFNLSGAWNIAVASFGDSQDFIDSYQAEDDFSRYNLSIDYIRAFARDWQLHFNVAGQWTEDHLIAAEQFGIGGMDSVRGFQERADAGDSGYRWSIEAISPDFGRKFADKLGLRGVVFYDAGHIEHEDLLTDSGSFDNTSAEINIASVGGGLRFNYDKHLVGRLDYAVVVDGDKGLDSPSGLKEKGDMHMHVSLGWFW